MTFSKLGTDRDTGQFVYLPKTARTQGLYIIGIQGTGKSGLIENLIMQDIDQQIGVCVLDPHGELIDQVIARLEPKNEKDAVLLDLTNYSYPFGLNLFECPDPTDDGEIVKTLYQVLHVFEKAYGIVPTTPLMYDLLYNAVYTLIANPGYTMIDIRLLLTNEICRKKLVANVPNPDVSDFWSIWDDPKQTTPQERENKRGTILNKMNEFSHVPLRNIVGQIKTTFSLQDIMDTGKILLVKLSRRLEQPSNLIGSIIIAQLLNAAYARQVNKRKQFHLFADEFQNFATEDFATLLEEARKFGIGTTIAHQNRSQLNSAISQLETNLKDRSRSVGNLVVFKINSKDADDLASEFDTSPPPPTPEEKTRRAILTPVNDVVGWLLSNRGGQANPIVNRFATTTLMKLDTDRQYRNSEIDTHFYRLNQLLYEAMVNKRFDTPLPVETLKYFLYRLEANYPKTSYPLGIGYPILVDYDEISPGSCTRWDYHTIVQGVQVLWSQQSSSTLWQQWISYLDRTQRTYIHEEKLMLLSQELWRLGSDYGRSLFDAEVGSSGAPSYRPSNRTQQENIALTKTYWKLQYPEETWYTIDIEKWVNVTKTIQQGMDESQKIKMLSQYFYNPADLDRAAEAELQEQKTIFLNFLWELKQVMQALAQTPIKGDSGQQEIVMGHGLQFSSAEMTARISNQLSGLPPFTARVKMGETFPQNPGKKCLSCGLLNNPGMLVCGQCGTKITAPNEYTIKTIKPTGHIGTQQFDQRMKRIQTKNLQQDGYVRERVKVEAEITQRQTGCSVGSAPAHPQRPPQQPPQGYARQVPVQRNCQNCGKSNPPGSQFCNQCGTKLT